MAPHRPARHVTSTTDRKPYVRGRGLKLIRDLESLHLDDKSRPIYKSRKDVAEIDNTHIEEVPSSLPKFTKATRKLKVTPVKKMKVKTRFLLVSDTHNLEPTKNEDVPFQDPLPRCDVFIHAGDMTKYGTLPELQNLINWVEKQVNAEIKILIAGNHDLRLDETYWARVGNRTADENVEESQRCKEFLRSRKVTELGIWYLENEIREFRLKSGATLRVLASPNTPKGPSGHSSGSFRYSPTQNHWKTSFGSNVKNIDIIISHTPPHGILDENSNNDPAGCSHLLQFTSSIKPLLHVFGHIHEAWGAKIITWNQESLNESRKSEEKANRSKQKSLRLSGHIGRDEDRCLTMNLTNIEDELVKGQRTLFVNAAIAGLGSSPVPMRNPILVDLDLRYVEPSVYEGTGEREPMAISA